MTALDASNAGLAMAVVGGAVWTADRWRRRDLSFTSHGDSRWARRGELRAIRVGIDKVRGAVIGWHSGWVLRLPDEDNLILFGVQRSGKTSTVVVPTLLNWPGTVVATSTKEELVALTGRHRAKSGPVCVFAPLDSDHTWVRAMGLLPVAWNPLTGLDGSGSAAELADVFTSAGKASHSPHWYHSAANLLTGLFLLCQARQGDLSTVLDLLNATPLPGYALLGQQLGGRAQAILAGVAQTPPEEAGSIVSTARAALSLWLDDRVAAATRTAADLPGLSLEQVLTEGATLYLVAPAEDADRCRPLFTALLGSLLRSATATARMRGGILSPRLLLALDEAANFARVPRLVSYVSTGPGQGIQTILCFHDLAQLQNAYGPEGAGTIWNNCRARLLLPGQADLPTLELFSRSMGYETVVYTTRSWARGGASTSEARVGRALRTIDQLRRSPDPVLIFSSAPPARLTARRWDQVPHWRALVEASQATVPATA